MQEPGLDLHEWESRWADLDDAAADSPDETLPEMVRAIEEMLVERSFQLDEPVTAEGEEPEIVRAFLSAREVARLLEKGEADAEDVANAIDDLRGIHEYLIEDRPRRRPSCPRASDEASLRSSDGMTTR